MQRTLADPQSPAAQSPALTDAGAMTPEAMRARMPVARRIAYFDHAAVAPISGPAADAIAAWTREAAELGDTVWLDWWQRVEATRRSAAAMIGADTKEIALAANTTAGINFVAEGIDWRGGDNLVLLADEYPSNVYPWMHQRDRGVETRFVPTDAGRPDLDKLRAAIDARTRVVSVSWVGFSTGYRQDLDVIADITRTTGALFFLDAIQGLGVFEIDVRRTPVDFLAADGHKWMLGPEGAAFAYLRRERLGELRAVNVGASSVVNHLDYSTIDYRLRPTAARYEGGSLNIGGLIGLGASLELLAAWDPKNRADAVLAISDLACERLRSLGAEIISHREPEPNGHDPRSGIVSFTLSGRDPIELRKRCLAAGVALSCRAGRLRIAPHAYTNADDVDRLAEALSPE